MPPMNRKESSSRTHPVEEDMGIQRAQWMFERIGWYLLVAVIVAAVLGLFANGPLSRTTVQDPSQKLTIEFDRLARSGASGEMRLHADPQTGQDVTVRFSTAFMRAVRLTTIEPQPAEARSSAHGTEYVFGRKGGAPLDVYLEVLPQRVGLVQGEIALDGNAPAAVSLFVYP